ncbi:MAG: helix-turn-helix transcriptional regulator [Burkholderiales bacterium]|nr:helix-turn-helix transcriptional regulator [Burkholderiales bacterium]
MLDLIALESAVNPMLGADAVACSRAYPGPERRNAASLPHRRLAQMLDAIDYGMLLLTDETRLVHINKAARHQMDAHHPLQLLGQELRARLPHDVLPLREALAVASGRGMRRLVELGDDIERTTIAVVPLPPLGADERNAVLVVLGKRRVCEELTVDWFARSHGLTIAETCVLKGLCADCTPQEIATKQGVKLATIRTQIGSIRTKTGAPSIRALVQQVAVLPPLVSALQGSGPLGQEEYSANGSLRLRA